MSQAKVVSLDAAKPSRTAGSSVPPILQSVRQRAKRQLGELLQGLFNNTDDALFEMADRSRSDMDQNMYFESMRQIRIHRKAIAKRFVEGLYRGFEAVFEPGEVEASMADVLPDDVALVQNDELEVSVAVAGIVSKVTSQFSLPIMQLTRRIDYLCKHQSITERMNPLGPEQLSKAFVNAMETLDVDIKVRIILLKLFERFVMERLAPVFQEANQMLAEAGVLTDLKNHVRGARSPQPSPDTGRSDSNGSRSGSIGGTGAFTSSGYSGSDGHGGFEDEPGGAPHGGSGMPGGGIPGMGSAITGGFGTIQRLLQAARGGPSNTGTGSGPVISTDQLVSALSRAQLEFDATTISLEQVPPLLDLRQVAVTRAADLVGEPSVSMGQADDDAVNFVGMLFDYILNDKNLAIPMKALIGRLQIPIVKLAVMDKSFFEKPNHPARQLLNELSSAGIGWSGAQELKRDLLYNKIESIVLRVMNAYVDDPTIFKTLVDELRAFLNKDRQKNELVEQRVKESETGKGKTLKAKQVVQQLINQTASGMRLPTAVGGFISKTWSRVLVYAFVTEGENSRDWQDHVQTLDDLLWCLQPLDNLDALERRDEMSERLLSQLSNGMRQIKLTDDAIQEILDEVKAQLLTISSNDRAYLEDDEVPQSDAEYEQMEEIILTAPQDTLDPPDMEPPEPEFLERINQLSEGVWVELRQDDGHVLRCKLATIVEPGSRYIFVNRRGMKVVEKSRMGLAVSLKNGTMTVLDESQVFDRALQAVIGNLRQLHERPAQKLS